MSFLLAISAELARIHSPQELVCAAMGRLRRRLEPDGAGIGVTLAEFDDSRHEAVVLRESGDDESRVDIASLPLESFQKIATESQKGVTTVVCDTRTDLRASPLHGDLYSPQGVGAIVSVPLYEGDVLVALLSVVSPTPRDWSESEVELITSVAEIAWPALEKARADRAVTMGEERLRLAQAVTQIGTWDWDPDTREAFFSAESVEIFGLSSAGPEAQTEWQAGVDPLQVSAVLATLDECVASGTREIEYRYRHPTRGIRWIYNKAGRVEHAGHRHVVGISLDVTARREAEEALREVNQRKDEFLAMLAHELRNPLAPIRNAAQLLKVHAPGIPEIEWARAVIERQTKHLVRLVDDLLDVSRMVRGQIALQRKPVDLAEIIQNAVETSRPLIRLRKHNFNVNLPDKRVCLEADLTRIAQVISNLLNNAAKYTDEGGLIQLDAAVEGSMIAIRVRDTGLGIAANLLPHVFDLFTQADRTLDRAEGGLGIGLTLVKRLVEMHGGSVQALSEGLGQGAEFIIRLPVLEAAQDVIPEPVKEVERLGAPPELRNLRILIVDDNVDAADSIAMLLGMEGHLTRTVNTARAALLAAPDFMPNVVLLDIGLPEMDGYEVARRLRSQNMVEGMRLVAVTGYGQPADRRRAHDAGFDQHLVKPVEPAVLQQLLRSVQGELID